MSTLPFCLTNYDPLTEKNLFVSPIQSYLDLTLKENDKERYVRERNYLTKDYPDF